MRWKSSSSSLLYLSLAESLSRLTQGTAVYKESMLFSSPKHAEQSNTLQKASFEKNALKIFFTEASRSEVPWYQ